jgi:hypothetical protein
MADTRNAFVHWPDGADEIRRVFRGKAHGAPLVFAEANKRIQRLRLEMWRVDRVEERSGSVAGRPFELEVWVKRAGD